MFEYIVYVSYPDSIMEQIDSFKKTKVYKNNHGIFIKKGKIFLTEREYQNYKENGHTILYGSNVRKFIIDISRDFKRESLKKMKKTILATLRNEIIDNI